jgi:hypothetical protein
MRAVLIRGGATIGVAVFLGVVWLATARQLSELVDAVRTVRVANLSPSPFAWNGVWLQFGPPLGDVKESLVGRMPGIDPQFRGLSLTGPGPLYGPAAKLAVNAEGRLVLSAGGKSFVLGTRTGNYLPVEAGDLAMPEFGADPGDSASLVIERSILAWPTPFELNVVGLGGANSTWRRHVYYRLSWVKQSGARLNMLWAGEQPFYGVDLWGAPGAFLTRVEIR